MKLVTSWNESSGEKSLVKLMGPVTSFGKIYLREISTIRVRFSD